MVIGLNDPLVKELQEASLGWCVQRIQEGIGRVTDEYIRSAIDWMENVLAFARYAKGQKYMNYGSEELWKLHQSR